MHRKVLSAVMAACMGVSLWTAGGWAAASGPVTSQIQSKDVQTSQFSDMAGHWASEAANRLRDLGIVKGYPGGEFRPNQPISRSEYAVMLTQIFRYTNVSTQSYTDVNDSDWYAEDLAKAREAGIVNGYVDGSFRPRETIARQDAALLLERALKLGNHSDVRDPLRFADADTIAGYARGAVQAAVNQGYLNGDGQGRLLPSKPLTRAEAAAMLNRAFGWIGTHPGNFNVGEVHGNAVINQSGITLSNTVVRGNLYITEGVGDGDVVLDQVKVEGSTFVEGGGVNSVHLKQSRLAELVGGKKGQPVRVVIESGSTVDLVVAKKKMLLEVSPDSQVNEIRIDEEAQGTSITNKGTIGSLQVNAEGVTLNGKAIAKGSELKPSDSVIDTGSTPGSNSGSDSNSEDWSMIWNDEFDGGAIDTSKWNVENTGTVYNNELEYYHPDNASIAKDGNKGVLRLTAKKQEYNGRNYTSGKLTSKMKGDWTYGKFVVRAKLPIQQGMWPAIWMMPTDELEQYGPWPGSGEMDIMELTGPVASDPEHADKYPRTVHGSLHYDIPHASQSKEYVLPAGNTFADDYHEFTMEWLPGLIRYYVDGNLYFESNDWGTKKEGQAEYYSYPAPFDRPFYLILNLAVGGDWPGSPKADFDSDRMDVDYVRVYKYNKLASLPDVTGQRPDKSVGVMPQRQPLEDGNQIYNGDFADGSKVDGVPVDWEFLLNANGGGSVSIVDDPDRGKAAKVDVTAAGDQKYSVQLTQKPIFLKKGKTYKITFDAKADSERTIMSKLTEFGGGWTAYSQERNFTLSDQWQSYEYIFSMKAATDNNARFEFNLGLSTIASYLANVRVTETEALPETRTPLADGNLIFNGSFDQGIGRMAYWQVQKLNQAAADAVVTNDLAFPLMQRMFKAVIQRADSPEDVKLVQKDLPLEEGKTYTLTFDAKADVSRQIQIALDAGAEGSVSYVGGTGIQLTTDMRTYSKDITVQGGESVTAASLELLLGGQAGTVFFDNIRLVKRTSPPMLDDYLHLAADSYWSSEGVTSVSGSEGGKNLTGFGPGGYALYKLVASEGNYVPMVRIAGAKAGSTITLNMLDENLTPLGTVEANIKDGEAEGKYQTVFLPEIRLSGICYLQVEGSGYNLAWLELSKELADNGGFDNEEVGWTLFKKDWEDTDPVKDTVMSVTYGQLNVQMAGAGTEVWNVQVKQPNKALRQGGVYRLHFEASSSVARDIVALVQHDGTSDNNWTSYLEKPTTLTAGMTAFDYVFVMPADERAAVLQFSMGKIGNIEGEHIVKLDNISLLQVNPLNAGIVEGSNLLPNGDFATGVAGWSSYSTDAGQLSIRHGDEGTLHIDVGTAGSNSWDRQVFYEGVPYNNGNRYKLTFKAKATKALKMNISVGWLDAANNYAWHGYGSQIVDLDTDYQVYSYTFDVQPDSTVLGRIAFELGKIDNGGGNAAVDIDDIRLTNEGPTPAE